MHMIFRTFWHMFVIAPRRKPLRFADVSRSRFRVWPTDLDVLNQMNNGKYLSIMDVCRFDMIKRTGTCAMLQREGWYPVVVAQTITYRKSLNPWKRFWIESKILGFDEQAVYMEQRFVRPDASRRPEVYARAIVRARFLKKSGGVVKIDELIEKTGADRSEFRVPEDILAWGRATQLPPTRAEAPSVWE